MKRPALLAILLCLLMAILVNASLLPDPCSGCSGHAHCESGPAADCSSLCCSGVQGTPEPAYVLRCIVVALTTWNPSVLRPDPIAAEPLQRPPMSA
jgi:hypothetical protein